MGSFKMLKETKGKRTILGGGTLQESPRRNTFVVQPSRRSHRMAFEGSIKLAGLHGHFLLGPPGATTFTVSFLGEGSPTKKRVPLLF